MIFLPVAYDLLPSVFSPSAAGTGNGAIYYQGQVVGIATRIIGINFKCAGGYHPFSGYG
jgi:hypothetical protein